MGRGRASFVVRIGPKTPETRGNAPIRGFSAHPLRIPCGSLAGGLRLRPPEFSLSPETPVAHRTQGERRHEQQEPHLASSSTARKVVGSLGVIGAAAAVAGMGTFGTFTDSTTPVATTIQSGTLSIDVSQQGYAVPVTTTGFVPGDSLTRAVNLVNDGNVAARLGHAVLRRPPPERPDHRRHQRPAADREVVLGRVDPGRHRLGADLRLLRHRDASSARARPSPTSR